MSYGHLVPEEAPLRDHGGVVPVLAGDGHQGEPALLDPALHHLPQQYNKDGNEISR